MGMTREEYEAFHAQCIEAGKRIDPQNCEVLRMHVKDHDPYNVFDVPLEEGFISAHWFIRALPDGKWIEEYDVTKDIIDAVQARKLRSAV